MKSFKKYILIGNFRFIWLILKKEKKNNSFFFFRIIKNERIYLNLVIDNNLI
jgi:hypothetical protein